MLSRMYLTGSTSSCMVPVVSRVLKVAHNAAPAVPKPSGSLAAHVLSTVSALVPAIVNRPVIITAAVAIAASTTAQCMEADLSLSDFVAELGPEIVDTLIASPPKASAAAAAAAAGTGSDDDSPQPELSVDRDLVKIGKTAKTELLEGTIVDIGSPGTLTAGKVLLEFIDKKAMKKRKRETDPIPKLQRWISMELLTHVSRASPTRATPISTQGATDASPRAGPLFPEAASLSETRATRPSAGEGSSSSGTMPTMAAHERGRMMKQKPSAKERLGGHARGTAGEHKTKETNVPISKRIAEFPNESFKESPPGHLFCQCCPKGIQNILGTIKTHVASDDHKEKYLKWIARNGDDEAVKQFMHEYYADHPNEIMATSSTEEHLYRYRVVESVLFAGIAINKVDSLRPLLERANFSLTDSSHLKQYIPKIETREVERVIKEISGQRVTIIFDGTTRLGEALVILIRWIPADFSKVEQRLVAFRTTFKHTSGAELAQLLMQVLLTTLKVQPAHVVGGARDSCSTNGVAMRAVKTLLTNMQDFMCISHTLSHTGEHVELSTLDSFMTPWLSLVQHHPSAKSLWKESIGKAMVGYSTIRWCSREEVQNQIALNFGALGDFLQTLVDRDIGEAHPKKMMKIYNEKRQTLEAEMALSLDLKVIIETVYTLEGDGLLILLARSKIDALLAFGDTVGTDQSSLPNLAAVLKKNTEIKKKTKMYEWYGPPYNDWYEGEVKDLHRGGKVAVKYTGFPGQETLLEPHEARAAIDIRQFPEWKRLVQEVKNGIGYLRNRLTGNCEANYDCTQIYEVYRLVQAFDPSFAAQYIDPAWVDALAVIPPLAEYIPRLKHELPAYLSKCAGTAFDHDDAANFTKDILLFWQNNGKLFPTWALAMQIVGSFTPNSAAAERVFSLLKLMFGDAQMLALADMIQAALMLRYNERKVG